MMVVLGKAVGLVADVLQEPQRVSVAAEPQRLVHAGLVDLLLAFGQRNDRRRRQSQFAKCGQPSVQLPLASVDQQNVGKSLTVGIEPLEPPPHPPLHGTEGVTSAAPPALLRLLPPLPPHPPA